MDPAPAPDATWLEVARSHLRGADPVLARLIDQRPAFDPRAWMAQLPPMDLYGALLFQVTGQQLSVAATRRTLARIQALFGGRLPRPAELLRALPGDLALRKAIAAAYQLGHLPTEPEVLAIAERWRPYRSLATSYLFSAAFDGAQPGGPS
jgi:3-methyladenine DNA glycosylase/8-oxoguanine DNA glycosylase